MLRITRKMRPQFGLLLVTLVLASTAVFADHHRSELAQSMKQIESSFAFLRANVENDALNQDNILEIDLMIEAAQKAAGLQPPGAHRMAASKRERYVKGYRAALQALVDDATKLRAMVKQNEPPEKRYEQLTKLLKHREKSHRSYQRRRR